jgi:hypothetical protein
VLAVRSNHVLRLPTAEGLQQTDPGQLADALSSEEWAAHAAGEGSKGLRLYDWARLALPWTVNERFERWLLIRRSRRDAQERAYYLVFAPAGTGLAELAGAAGLRLARLAPPYDPVHGSPRLPCRVVGSVAPRGWQQTERTESVSDRGLSVPMLPLPSVPEIRYLIARLLLRSLNSFCFILAWSRWRRRHQAAAARAQYRAQQNLYPQL